MAFSSIRVAAIFHALSLATVAVACTAPTEGEAQGSSEAAAEVFADGLWAGQTTITMERYASDPCSGTRRVDRDPIAYDEWSRQRAGVKNVCFEVWKPGVTDRENPDFWRELDVQVHYRYGSEGEFKTKYVSSIDRRGNNRRYAWSLDMSLDPLVYVGSVATMRAPFTILSESENPVTGEGSATVRSTMEFYFTVNGKVLNASNDAPYRVDYMGYVRTSVRHRVNPAVLHERVACRGASFGGGAGYNAVDITDAAAIDALASGLDGSLIYGAGLNVADVSGTRSLSVSIGGSILRNDAETLPHYMDNSYSGPNVQAVPSGDTLTLKLAAYDRASQRTRVLEHTFTGCSLARP